MSSDDIVQMPESKAKLGFFERQTLLIQMFKAVREAYNSIQPQERTQLVLPKILSHVQDGEIDWDVVEDVQTYIRGYNLRPNVFATLRFDQDEVNDVIVDMCYLPEHVEMTTTVTRII